MTTGNPFSYEKFLWILERDHMFLVDETRFYFNDDADKSEHYLGCLRAFQKPYWVGYCDVPDGCEFDTAYELLNAPIYDGHYGNDGKTLCSRRSAVFLLMTG